MRESITLQNNELCLQHQTPESRYAIGGNAVSLPCQRCYLVAFGLPKHSSSLDLLMT